MKSKIISKVVFTTLIGSFFMFQCFLFVPTSFADDVVIIGNKGINETSLSKQKLKSIFLKKSVKWNDNKKIVVVTLKKGAAHELFLDKYIDKTKSQFKTYHKSLFFAGKGKMPKTFKSQKSLIKYVANTNGAIGYVSSDVDLGENVKIIEIN